MSLWRLVLVLLAAVPLAACGRGAAEQPAKPVVLWSSGTVEPRFPIPPEAAWKPVYQRLRQKDEARRHSRSRWACYGSGRFDTVLRFYASAYGFSQAAAEIKSTPAVEAFTRVRREAAALGHVVPSGPAPPGTVRSLTIGQRENLPMLLLQSPYLDLTSGKIHHGTLISMCWTRP